MGGPGFRRRLSTGRPREVLDEVVSGVLEFGRLTASSIAAAASSLIATVRVDEDSDTVAEEMPLQEVWGEAALLWRPADPDSSGGPEAIVWRRGDELVVIASKDRRWQVSLGKGEVIIRALGNGAPVVRLDPATGHVFLGATSASQFVALSNLVESNLNALKTAISGAGVTPGDGGAAFKTALLAALATWPTSTAATKVKAI